MTISTTSSRVSYVGNGTTTSLPVTFPFFGTASTAELEVIERDTSTGVETTKTNVSDFTVTGGNGSTGTVTAVTAPATGKTWTIRRNTSTLQGIDFTANDAFPAETLESGLDRAAARHQELVEAVSRAITVPKTDSSSLDLELPSSVDRASKFMAFDSSGNAIASSGTTGTVAVSSFGETLVGSADAAAARATLNTFEDVFTTRGDLLRAGASGAEERVALGTTGNALISDGTDAAWGRPYGALLAVTSYQTAETDTHTYQSATRLALVEVQGGGGGSGGIGSTDGASSTGGGGQGGFTRKLIDVSARTDDTYTVGAGGTAGASGNNNGGTGGTSSWASDCSATGGAGSVGNAGATGTGAGAAGGAGSGGDLNLTGQAGETNTSSGGGGGGGQGGGVGRAAVGNGTAGANGGGAGGALTTGTTQRAGAAGGDGWITVWEFA